MNRPPLADTLPSASAGRIREAVQEVVESSVFKNSARMCRFLVHIVEAELAGDAGCLKETAIGVAVFDRPPDYDPKSDPIVRNEARRLRSKLEQYYGGEGAETVLRIEVPKGGYAPRFAKVLSLPETAAPRRQPGTPPGLSWSTIAAGLVLLTLAVTGWFWRGARESEARVDRISPLTSDPQREIQPAISPDGRWVAYSSDRDGQYRIYRLQPGANPHPLSAGVKGTGGDFFPSWSPSGREIAFARLSEDGLSLIVVPAESGAERLIARVPALSGLAQEDSLQRSINPGPAWSADGKYLIASTGTACPEGCPLQVIRISDGQVRRLTGAGESTTDFGPVVSPDGKWVSFARLFTNSTSRILVVPFDGGAARAVLDDLVDVRGIAWSPDQKSLVVSCNLKGPYQLWRIRLDRGSPALIPTSGVGAIQPALSKDGRTLVYADFLLDSQLARVRVGGPDTPEPVVRSTRQNHSAQYSPDGRSIAYMSNSSGSWELWLSDAEGSNQRQVTHFQGPLVGSVRWAPNGESLAFDGRAEGHSAIYLIRPDGTGLRRANQNQFEEKMPSFSRDGRYLYFNSNRDGAQRLWRQELSTDAVTRMTGRMAMDSAESLAGDVVYFVSRGAAVFSTTPAANGDVPVAGMEAAAAHRLWCVDQSGIWYLGNDVRSVFLYDPSTRQSRLRARLTDPLIDTPSLSVSPDRKWILYSQKGTWRSDLMIATGSF